MRMRRALVAGRRGTDREVFAAGRRGHTADLIGRITVGWEILSPLPPLKQPSGFWYNRGKGESGKGSEGVKIICLDLEGILVPEIWIAFSETTGISELRLTTRDEPDYDRLMKRRIRILKEHGLKLRDIQAVIGGMDPLNGAREFLDGLRERSQVLILSDTFEQFADPLMRKLGRPTLFCNTLSISADGAVEGYTLRQDNGKRKAVEALAGIGYRVLAVGDSYNDVAMLQASEAGVFYRPPDNIVEEFPAFPVTRTYDDLAGRIAGFLEAP